MEDRAVQRMLASVEHDGVVDRVAVEEPLEIRVGGEPLVVTMRTPGHDEELAAGFLFGEGLIGSAPDSVGPPADLPANTIEVDARLRYEPGRRSFFTSSSCGVCGKGALDEVAVHAPPLPPWPGEPLPRALLAALPDRLRQPAFAESGGLHATGLFDRAGKPLCVREDVGRHNAMDKVVGRALLDGAIPPTSASSACRGACRSSSCRRPPWPALPCSSAWGRRRPWPSNSPATAA